MNPNENPMTTPKNGPTLTQLLSLALKVAIIAAVSIIAYQHFHDPVLTAEIGRLKGETVEAKREVAIAHRETAIAADRLDSALSAQPRTITRWRTVTDTVPFPVDATPHDSIAALSTALTGTRSAAGEVVRACTELANACTLYRAKATAEIASWEHRYSVLDSLYKAPRPGRHWNLSLSVGLPLYGGEAFTKPVVAVSVGRSLVQW